MEHPAWSKTCNVLGIRALQKAQLLLPQNGSRIAQEGRRPSVGGNSSACLQGLGISDPRAIFNCFQRLTSRLGYSQIHTPSDQGDICLQILYPLEGKEEEGLNGGVV